MLLVPLSFCAYNVSCLFNGLVYYNQWGRLYWWQILLVLFGISQVLVGVLVLAWRPASGDEFGEDIDEQEEATLLLPNSSRPSTPRHSTLFSFKGPSQAGVGGVPQQMHQQDPSLDARNLIQGFEMYDSDEDTTPSSRRPSEEEQSTQGRDLLGPRLITLDSSDINVFSEEPSSLSPTNAQPSKTLAFDSKGSRGSQ